MRESAGKLGSLVSVALVGALLMSGCVAASGGAATEAETGTQPQRAVVIVSGGDAVSPFTTPGEACASGLAAGNTDTALREALLAAGHEVYTAPAMNARGPVQEPDPTSFGAFGDCPPQLPAHMTIVSTGDIDNAGEHLARFIQHLHDAYGITEVDFVGHSNGGLFARAAIRVLTEIGAPVKATSLVTLGTPWMGGNPLRIIAGEVPESECQGQESCLAFVEAMRQTKSLGLVEQDTYGYLLGDDGWNAAQAGVLDDVPTLLIGGTFLDADGGDPEFWPNDGLVSEYSALAKGVGDEVLPQRSCASFPLLHSIYIAEMLDEEWQVGMTWNTEVLETVAGFLADVGAGVGAGAPTRAEC